jgi:hypothetical protein
MMSASNGGAGSADPLLAALTGTANAGTGSIDPLLSALNASDAANSGTTGQSSSTPSSGVNILI